MSALGEYRNGTSDFNRDADPRILSEIAGPAHFVMRLADAAIAEVEAEVEGGEFENRCLLTRAKRADAERDEWEASFNEKCAQCGRLQSRIGDYIKEKLDLEKRARQAEAELAALRARRCEGCSRAYDDCSRRIMLTTSDDAVDIDYCSKWAKRSTP